MESRQQEKLPDTVNMLLDVSNFQGESSKRLGPILIFFLLAAIPILIYAYILSSFIPFKVFLPVYIVICIWIALIVIGEQPRRVEQYKQMLYDVYSSSYDLVEIKTVHPDGLVEYNNGTVVYFIIAENGNEENAVIRAQSLQYIITKLAGQFDFDIYIQNISHTEELYSRYSTISSISDPEVAGDYVDSIDFAIDKAKCESLHCRTIYVCKELRSGITKLRQKVQSVMTSDYVETYNIFKLATPEEAEELAGRDIDTYINFTELQTMKYFTGNYEGNEVLEYDVASKIQDTETLSSKHVEEVRSDTFLIKE